MTRRMLTAALTSLALAFGAAGAQGPSTVVSAQSAPGLQRVRVFIGFDRTPGAEEQAIVRGAGGQIRHSYALVPAIAAEVPEPALNGLRNNPRITYIEPVGEVTAFDAFTDELNRTWGVKRIGASSAWPDGVGAGVKVAVIDSGIDASRPDLSPNYAAADSWDFVNEDNNPADDNGHGTHVSGTIAGSLDGNGVVGVAPGVQIMAVKVLNAQGSGSWDDVVAGVQWAVQRGAHVTNSSLGSNTDPGTTVANAYAAAKAAGVVNIASAGNSGNCAGKGNSVGYPARYPSVLAVAATDSSDKRPCFSSTGPAVGIAAPGVAVNSTVPLFVSNTGFALFSGTSMASPHVAGVAALIVGTGKFFSDPEGHVQVDQVVSILKSTATDLGAAGVDPLYGSGLVNASAAFLAAMGSTGGGGDGGGGDGGGGGATGQAFVDRVDYSLTGGGKNGGKNLRIEVRIIDLTSSVPVAGATVSVRVTRDTWTGTGVATTSSTGVAAFTLSNAPSGLYSTSITEVIAAGYTWLPDSREWTFTKP